MDFIVFLIQIVHLIKQKLVANLEIKYKDNVFGMEQIVHYQQPVLNYQILIQLINNVEHK